MKLVIIRHGGTRWSRSGRYTGITDLPLTRQGARQAAALAPLLERMLAGDGARVFSQPPEQGPPRPPPWRCQAGRSPWIRVSRNTITATMKV